MLQKLAVGCLIVCLTGSAACGTASVLECQAQALRILPANVDDIDVGVARELGRRIHACEQGSEQQSGDAGAR